MSKNVPDKHVSKRWVGCSVEADYFGDERKSSKALRKQATAKDRSKYKKSDRDKILKLETTQAPPSEHLLRGRVLSIASQGILVDQSGEILVCTLRGALKKEKSQHKNLVAVGDFVLLEKKSHNEGQIFHVEPRRTVLSRADNLDQRKEQLIATNIDQVLITVSVVNPPLKPPLIDRYIIATQKGGMEPVIVVNKIDLLNDNSDEIELYNAFIHAYKASGVPVIPVSVVSGQGVDQLREAMRDKASVFSGQSGVGKSSLINTLAGLDIPVGHVVERTQKGTHTTSSANLILLPFGGWCIDTPGIKSFGLWKLDPDEVAAYFSEIQECVNRCRYQDCTHTGEAGCSVESAVEEGKVSALRYESYKTLMASIAREHKRR